jgi:hypothetical protein
MSWALVWSVTRSGTTAPFAIAGRTSAALPRSAIDTPCFFAIASRASVIASSSG